MGWLSSVGCGWDDLLADCGRSKLLVGCGRSELLAGYGWDGWLWVG